VSEYDNRVYCERRGANNHRRRGTENVGRSPQAIATAARAGRLPLRASISRIGRRAAAWIAAAADYCAAATIYEQLSRLSDAELRKRGLSRGELGHHVREIDSRSL